jgi:hypothetical protein
MRPQGCFYKRDAQVWRKYHSFGAKREGGALGRKYSHFVLASDARVAYIGSELLTARRGNDVE